jgi:hypothetical protein
MWRFLTVLLIGGVLGTGFGVALGFFLFPYVFPPPAAMESLTEAERTAIVARGAFIHANPSDRSSMSIWCRRKRFGHRAT